MHPELRRVAAVFGSDQQGSGYVLTPWAVITAAHVVSGSEAITVATPGGGGQVRCSVMWKQRSRDCDVALLLASRELLPDVRPPEMGVIYDTAVRDGAQAIGFPQVQRGFAGELDTEQLVGTLKPGSGALSGFHVLDNNLGAPFARPGGGSPWAGMSGAAVFFDDLLVGVVSSDPGGWQHGRVTLSTTRTLLRSAAFHMCCTDRGIPINRANVPIRSTGGPAFEQRLRAFITAQHRELTIIGLSQSGPDADSWPLDASYLSLELLEGPDERSAMPSPEQEGTSPQPVAERAEQALAGRRRVVIRGSAGSGKTTLLQWLASSAAGRELPAPLEELNDCVPLLLRLRSLVREGGIRLPAPEEFLAEAARPLSGQPGAAGWATQQLETGRLLLLVDGVDEVPEKERPRTRAWLEELLTAYPDARCVVTTRPSAVTEGWLSRCGFSELELLPMTRSDVQSFVARWHAATRSSSDWQSALNAAMVTKPDLGRLATNPLMCALICALNSNRRGFLPESRMELYAAALEMLLVRRDRERGVTQGLVLNLDQQTRILQKLAYWLTVNCATEMSYQRAEKIVAEALPAMPAIAATAEQVLRHLILRSGLLRQPTTESLDFVHRTFQDYLGAKAAIENEDLGVLVGNAHDDQWEDVLRMAAGHARPRERAALLQRLLARADDDPSHRERLYVVAAACLENATELDPSVREDVSRHLTALIPPRDAEQGKALAVGGSCVLDLLPGPEGLDEESALGVVHAATAIGGDQAIGLLSRYAAHPSLHVRSQLARSWERFNARAYAEQVLARAAYEEDGLRFIATVPEHLSLLAELGGRPRIECSGPFSSDDLRRLPARGLTELRLHENPHPVDLTPIAAAPDLEALWIINCPGGIDLSPLLTARGLTRLCIQGRCRLAGLPALERMESIRVLDCRGVHGGAEALERLPLPPSLRELWLGDRAFPRSGLRGLEDCTELEFLRFNGSISPVERALLTRMRNLRSMIVVDEDLRRLTPLWAPPDVRELQLFDPRGLDALPRLAEAYPRLERLTAVWETAPPHGPLDLDALAPLKGCRVHLYNVGPLTGRRVPVPELEPHTRGGASAHLVI